MKNICVFCGSSKGNNSIYETQAAELGRLIAEQGYRLVYGGGKTGLMGVIADAVLAHGGYVIGVIPAFIKSKELGHEGVQELLTVETMHERKQKMEQLSDAFVAMPGGIGTFEELLEIFTWAQLNLHQKPICVLNVQGYYDHFLTFLQHSVQEGFMSADNKNKMLLDANEPNELLDKLRAFEAPKHADRWLNRHRRD